MSEDAYQQFRGEAREAVSRALKELGSDASIVLDRAPAGMGDIAFPCFPLAKQLRKSPDAIAKDLAARMTPSGMIEKVEPKGGYVNFTVKYDKLAHGAVDAALTERGKFGISERNRDVKILVEHTSVNPTGPIHVGRARNPIIGDTLARILRQAGYDVSTEFYVNDVGRQVVTMTWGSSTSSSTCSPSVTRTTTDTSYTTSRRTRSSKKALSWTRKSASCSSSWSTAIPRLSR